MPLIRKMMNGLRVTKRGLRSALYKRFISLTHSGIALSRSSRLHEGVRLSVSGNRAQVTIADGAVIDRHAWLASVNGSLSIGRNSYIGVGSVIVSRQKIDIGENALIAEYVTIRDQDHAYTGGKPTAENGFEAEPIVIGKNVWLGAKVTVTKGVTIGDNAVIGANSVVTKDIPANAVAVGVPARVIKEIDP